MAERGTRRALGARIGFFAGLAVIYAVIFLLLWDTPFYDVGNAHNDRLFSADDVYYSTGFFSTQMDTSPRIIKHPLLVVFGWLFTSLERLVFGVISYRSHYALIVAMQMCASVLSTIYLERILRVQYGLGQRQSLLICSIYALAFSTLFYTFVAESYILSALLIIMTFYYSRRQNMPVTVILGVLTAGVTITNAIIWAIVVVFSGGNWKRRFLTLAIGGAAFCLVTLITPIGRDFFAQVISGGINSGKNYSDHFGLIETVKRVFFIFFGSTAFYIDTAMESPFGDFKGDALSFLPSANIFIVVLSALWLALLIFTVVRCRREKMIYAPLAVLIFNLIFHGVMQYGLKEGFLYSLHHLPAQVLIVSMSMTGDGAAKRERTVSEGFLWCYLLGELTLNIPGYMSLAEFISR